MNINNKACLSNLPNEVLGNIFPFLEPKDFCKVSQVSRRFNVLIENEWNRTEHDTIKNRTWAAKFYTKVQLDVIDVPKAIKTQLDPNLNMFLIKYIISVVEEKNMPEIMKESLELAIKKFTLIELKKLAELYNTPIGKSILVKTSSLMVEMQQKISSQTQKVLMKVLNS